MRAQQILTAGFFILLPFLVLYWLVPGFSNLTIGADYIHYPIEAQMEINQSIEHGTFPLYAPGFAGGQSAAAMTLGQAFHPITHIVRYLPGYWEGDALTANTLVRLISIGLVHLLLFFTLRQLGLGFLFAFILSFLAVYNLRMLDHFRYGASLENHTAFLSLGSLILLYFLRPSSNWVLGGLFVSSYLLVVGGHPQIAYLGFIYTAVLALVAPYFIYAYQNSAAVDGGTGVSLPAPELSDLLKKWAWLLVVVVLGMLSAAPYVFPFYFEFLSSTSLRTQNPYEWSLSYQDSVGGILRNFFAPLRSDVMSSFGNSVLALWLVISIPFLALMKRQPKVIWIVVAMLVMALTLTLGNVTPVHHWVWKYFPLADSFRVPGRYSLWLLFPLLLLAIWLLPRFEKRELDSQDRRHLLFLTVAGISSLLVLVFACVWGNTLLPASGPWIPIKINDISNSIYDYWFYLALVNLLVLTGWLFSRLRGLDYHRWILLVFCIGVVIQTGLTLRYGTWVTENRTMPSLEQLDRNKYKSFRTEATPGFGLNSVEVAEQLALGFLDPFLARVYRDVVSFSDKEQMWKYLRETRGPMQAVVFSEREVSLSPSDEKAGESYDTVTLKKASFNELEFEVSTAQVSLFVTNIPYSPRWQIMVDGQETETLRANGHELSVLLDKAGKYQISMRYVSKSTATGLIVSVIATCLLLILLIVRSPWQYRTVALGGGMLLVLLFYYGWYESFYDAGEIRTQYQWSTKDFPSEHNLAYGRPAAASTISNSQMPYLYAPSKAVDGDIGGSGYVSELSSVSSWKLDLGKLHKLEEIIIYGVNRDAFPISIWSSESNDSGFSLIGTYKYSGRKLRLPGLTRSARFIVVSAQKNKRLMINEVEVYGGSH